MKSPTEIIARFLVRFAFKGFPPLHDHDSATSKDAVISQVASDLYLDCGHDMATTEAILTVCIKKGWIVAPFGLALGLGINQPTFEATQAGLEKGQEFLAVLNEQG
jgi:hypothetical protein